MEDGCSKILMINADAPGDRRRRPDKADDRREMRWWSTLKTVLIVAECRVIGSLGQCDRVRIEGETKTAGGTVTRRSNYELLVTVRVPLGHMAC